jgi:hypothetical protein
MNVKHSNKDFFRCEKIDVQHTRGGAIYLEGRVFVNSTNTI